MRVWVVTTGSYSDYRIKAIFTNKEAAEALAFPLPEVGIEEWETDEEVSEWPVGLRFYRTWLVLRTGAVNYGPIPIEPAEGQVVMQDHGMVRQNLMVDCWARDKDHALKITVEKYQEWLREHSHQVLERGWKRAED